MMWGRARKIRGIFTRPLWSPGGGGVIAFPLHVSTGNRTRATIKALPPLLTTLAPTDVDKLSVKLMPIGRPQRAPLHFTLITVQNCSGALRAPGVLLYFSETFTNSGIFPLIRWCRTGRRTRAGR